MKSAVIFHLTLRLFIIPFLFCGLIMPPQAQAQNDQLEPSEKYSREELAQMLAPIALYPDAVLSQVLMASTYPIEVIEADRWVKKNSKLNGKDLDAALLDKDWDPSVKAVCHFQSILALMSERITETTNLGNAFLAQEDEVLDMVQELRSRAYAKGNLASSDRQKIIVEKETIIIKPADDRIIYVPYYDPFHIYGPWWYPAYPPLYWGPPGISLRAGIFFWPGFYFGFAFNDWSSFHWHSHSIYIDARKRPRYIRRNHWLTKPGRWHHVPRHRRGVAYRDKYTARKYGQHPRRSREFRRDTRGFPEQGVWDRTRNRRIDEQTRIERQKRAADRAKVERSRLERERAEGERKQRVRAKSDQQKRAPIYRETRERQRVERERQIRLRTDQEKRKQQQLKRRPIVQPESVPVQSRDNVFNQVDNGLRELKSSKRGRVSRRQGRSRSDNDGQGSRFNRSRNR
ncbi:MAG: DUF3300 domain-containing protein [Desulfobulbaceae bacterium]|nr:DUF3300 domain-containing protein [Desulfobulbaceae bacterium]